jgi:hypothetical protein
VFAPVLTDCGIPTTQILDELDEEEFGELKEGLRTLPTANPRTGGVEIAKLKVKVFIRKLEERRRATTAAVRAYYLYPAVPTASSCRYSDEVGY